MHFNLNLLFGKSKKKMAKYVSFNETENYLLLNSSLTEITGDKGKKSFQKVCKPFCMLNDHLMHKNMRLVISKERQQSMI